MDRGAQQAIVHGVAKESDTTEQLTHNFQTSGHASLLGHEINLVH